MTPKTIPADKRQWLSRQDVADMLGVHVNTIDRLRAQRKLRSFKVGDQVRFKPEWIDDYIESHSQ
ncbi:helix-turn-helix domain-containing protein [Pseudonocardia kunmingensis]|uniref:Excisionase family DNA binding protein n=1 Tax=Pseudonocardia kunmingensis TaxID=630975 RepID=A0A543DAT5_9PSEU|nr:helix-turn-helix domain-containing protein [Pseudonocardia kunmingensis]TQM06440.1 excisionase family DNA binding protein [Pseudonocardia kunmingensis]